jgi:asparagine synthase (glutamine-hydrolysing)
MEAAQAAGVRLLVAGYFGDTLAAGGHFWALDMLRDGRFGMLASTIREHSSARLWRDYLFDNGLRQLLPYRLARAYRSLRPRASEPLAPGIHPNLVARSDLKQRTAARSRKGGFATPGFGHRYLALTPSSFSQGFATTRHQYNEHGLEVAMPYYDRRLVEFVMATPAYMLGRPGCFRLLQRQAMVDSLPEAVWRRKRRTTFAPLMYKGLRDREQETVRRILTNSQIVEREFVRRDWLEEKSQKPYEPSAEWSFLWRCICLELWLKRYWR